MRRHRLGVWAHPRQNRGVGHKLSVVRHAGVEASVNAWIITNGAEMVLVDALRSSVEARELAAALAERPEQLLGVLVTHGHPDHFLGLGALRQAFPDLPFWVASEQVRDDIAGFAGWMEDVGWLETEPHMKPQSEACSDGFRYVEQLAVVEWTRFEFPSGGSFEIRADYPATECAHISTVWLPEQRIFIASDLCYEGVHAWEGAGVERAHIETWAALCGELRVGFARGGDVTVCPGHGEVGGLERLAQMRTYLLDFLEVIDSGLGRSEAAAAMIALYPDHLQADFLLELSIQNHIAADGSSTPAMSS